MENSPTSLQGRRYLPRLDGLRAVAIMLVLAEHFYSHAFAFGGVGVTLFFVISGYLITSILLGYSAQLSVPEAARSFFSRRALRLLPVYYLCIAVTAAFGLGDMRRTWWQDALWLTNFRVALAHAWGPATHFWTLCVEEQFYLLWFAAATWMPRRYLLPVISGLIILGPSYRWLMSFLGKDWFAVTMLPGVIDSLATGALLAYASQFSRHTALWKRFEQIRMSAMLFFLAVMVLSQPLGVYSICLVNLFCICLVSAAADIQYDWRIDWLGGKAIRHLGRISYSLYVWHLFVPQALPARWTFLLWGNQGLNRLTAFATFSLLSIAIAEISWQLIEKPISRFKQRLVTTSKQHGPLVATA
jgi:peptidoglycan/LPS O-acetylase OafA/YrhL